MSNRSLIEINHDFTHDIKRDPAGFVEALTAYLQAGALHDPRQDDGFVFRGVRVIGMRHHSDPFKIQWGGHVEEQGLTPRHSFAGDQR